MPRRARLRLLALAIVLGLVTGTTGCAAARLAVARGTAAAPLVAILCYHDVSDDPRAPAQTVSPAFLRAQIRACRRDGWTFLSLSELLARRDRPESLPPRTMVLTFDDGLRSFRDRALPVLREEGVKATLAVITSFVSHPPQDMPALLTWDELRALERGGEVEIASHSHALHRYETSNPWRDSAPALEARRWLDAEPRYEDREDYRTRIGEDLRDTQRALRERLGHPATVLVWPYGKHNEMADSLAVRAGFQITLTLEPRAVTPADLRAGCLPRLMVTRSVRFAGLAWLRQVPPAVRTAAVRIEDLWSPDTVAFRARVDQSVERVRALGATDVILDVRASGSTTGPRPTWFRSEKGPVRSDVWSMIAAKLAQRRIRTWALVGTADYLAPAPGGAVDFLTDLAVYAPLDGVVFDDDGAPDSTPARSTDPKARLAEVRERMETCKAAIRAWRPECRFARVVPGRSIEAAEARPEVAGDLADGLGRDELTIVRLDATSSDALRRAERLAQRMITLWSATRPSPPALPEGQREGAREATPPPVLFELVGRDASGRWTSAPGLEALAAALRTAGIRHLGVAPVPPDGDPLPARLLEAGAATPRPPGGLASSY